MRFTHLISNLLLIAGIFEVPTVVLAKSSNVGQYAAISSNQSRQHVVVNTNGQVNTDVTKLTKKPSFVIEKALTQRGGDNSQKDALTGVALMTLIERATNKVLNAKGINFPSQLGGCIALLVFMIVGEVIVPGLGESVFLSLSPGAALLAKWLPVFFVPGLAMLPLAPSVGSGAEVAKVLLVTILGWVYSLCTVAYPVLFLRKSQANFVKDAPQAKVQKKGKTTAAPAKPYADETMSVLLKGTIVTAALSLAATKTSNEFATPLQSVFFCVTTFATYVWGARLPPGFTKTVHPLITCTSLTLGAIALTGLATGSTFTDVLRTYKVGSLDLMKTGAGDVLLFLLGPSVVSFAVSIYGKKEMLKENFITVMAAMLISSVGGLFGTAAFVKAIQLGGSSGAMVRLSVLSRNVTTALSMAIASILGGDISIAASVVVVTGIFGATYARRALDAMGIADPITRGLAVGASSQGLGVASLVGEPDAFPFAAMSMVLTAVCATIVVSVPALKDALIAVATEA